MISIKITPSGGEKIKETASKLAEKDRQMEQPLKIFGVYMIRSTQKNFDEGGRPNKWKVSERVKNYGRTPKGVLKTLIMTGRLKNSITAKVSGRTMELGTNVKYAAAQQFGMNIDKQVQVREHWRRVNQAFGKAIAPRSSLVSAHSMCMRLHLVPRPFLLVQQEDEEAWAKIFTEHFGEDK